VLNTAVVFRDIDLTLGEQRVVANAAAGESTVFHVPPGNAAAAVADPERTIRAEVIDAVLRDGGSRPLAISGAQVVGALDLQGCELKRPLTLRKCHFDRQIVLTATRAPSLDFSDSHHVGIEAAGLETRGDLILSGIRTQADIVLDGSRIGGVLALRDARLRGDPAPALHGERVEVRVKMDCAGMQADGGLHLHGARVQGVLDLRGAKLSSPDDAALNGDGLRVEQDLWCRTDDQGSRFTCRGALRLRSAHVGGILDLRGALLSNSGDTAFFADGLRVDQDLFCRSDDDGTRFEADGEVRLPGGHISGTLDFTGAHLTNQNGTALEAETLRVEQGIFLRAEMEGHRFEADGVVRLSNAHIGGGLFGRGALLSNPGYVVLEADGLHVESSVEWGVSDDGVRTVMHGMIVLIGGRIAGSLDLSGAHLINRDGGALAADGLIVDQDVFCRIDAGQRFEVDGEFGLTGARIGGQLDLSGARLSNGNKTALAGETLHVGQHVLCRSDDDNQRFECEGEIRLDGGHIGGDLDLRGAHLSNPGAMALNAEGVIIGEAFATSSRDAIPRFEVNGEVRLRGARISRGIDMRGAHLINPGKATFDAANATIEQSAHFESDMAGLRLEVDGQFVLRGAHVVGALDLRGARLANAGNVALDGDGLRIDHEILCRDDERKQRFTAVGEIRPRGAHVGGTMSFANSDLANPGGVALRLARARAGTLVLPRLTGDALIDLRYAAVTELQDDPAPALSHSTGYRARVGGLTYELLGPAANDCTKRLAWLERADDGYVPQAYEQLAAAYRRAGQDEDAKRVMIAKHVRRRSTLPPLGKVASFTLAAPVGYGYRTWRAAAALAAIVVIGWFVFSTAYPSHMTAIRPSSELPNFSGLLYSLDAVLPVVNLGQETAWSPRGVAQIWYGVSAILGWALALGLVALLTARFIRE
jgi:hypothetical protein